MKKLFVTIAILGTLASVLILLFSGFSMDLDKRIPIAIAIVDLLFLCLLAMLSRRSDYRCALAFAAVGIFLMSSSLFVIHHHWRPRSQVELILKDLARLPTPVEKSP
jgi:hypothetical protein